MFCKCPKCKIGVMRFSLVNKVKIKSSFFGLISKSDWFWTLCLECNNCDNIIEFEEVKENE